MKAYLFDFDGTLVDSMPSFTAVMRRVLEENGIACTKEIIKIITPLGYAGTAGYFVRELGMAASEAALVQQMQAYARDAYLYHIPAKNNVISVLQQLKAGGADLNVLTASPHSVLDPCLKRLGIYDLFTHVWSCEDFSTTKSDPAIYRMAAEAMGVGVGEVLFLDDNCNADKTAKSAGMQVCGVYDPSSADFEAEIRAVSDFYIYDFSQLLQD